MSSAHRRVRAVGVGAIAAGLAVMAGPVAAAGPASQDRTAGLAGSAASATPQVSSALARPAAVGSRSVTLITGDRVVVPDGSRSPGQVIRGEGRSHVQFRTFRHEGHLYVVPSDAVPLVQSGVLDRRLFDVTGLVQARYDDARRHSVPLIVTYADEAARSRGQSRLAQAGAEDGRALPAVDGMAVEVDKKETADFWKSLAPTGSARTLGSEIEKVWLDGVRKPVLDESVPQIGAPEAWAAGFTGEGVTVAVLDTGIDATHPDLEGQVTEAKDFSEEGPGDGFGHGTHVASIIAGTAKGSDGKYKGVAPDAKLLDGKVCDSYGSCAESAILAGMQWAATTKHASVVNLSLGGGDSAEIDPLEEAVNTLTAETGTLFVIAAGNAGPGARTVGSPGSADAALTVGAVDKQDQLAEFSSRGPRVGDGAIKPDLTAPGVDIVAAKAKGTELGEPVGEHYVTLSGTSMATPHVAGSAALLVQQHPDWKAPLLKSTLTGSAKVLPDLGVFEQGAGRVDVAKAITQTVTTDPVSLSFGLARWPHDDDEPVTKEVTYRNTGTADVTLALKAELNGPDGEAAPASALKLSASTVTIPAGGTATVSATSDTRHDGPDGTYSGRVVATAGDLSMSTPLGVEREVESYDLTVKTLDRDGKPSSNYGVMLFGRDADVWEFPEVVDGVARVRLPKGSYVLQADMFGGTEEAPEATMLVQPRVTLDKDLTVVADGAKAKPVTTTVERGSVKPALVDLGYDWGTDDRGLSSGLITWDFTGLSSAQLGPTAADPELNGHVTSQWAEPGADQSFAGSPYFYGLVNVEQGHFPTGMQRSVRDRDLAKVTTRYARQLPGRQASRVAFGSTEGMGGSWSIGLNYRPPFKVTSYLDPAPVSWSSELAEWVPDEDGFPSDQTALSSRDRAYQAGSSSAEQWNKAVLGPSLADGGWGPSVARLDNEISVGVALHADAAGHLGGSLADQASTTLYRDGKKVAESPNPGYFDDLVTVPGAKASFRLEVSSTRPTYSNFTTRLDTAWTFTSKHVAGEDPQALPLWAVRFSPQVDQLNRNHEGTEAMVPVSVEPQSGAAVGKARHLTVDVSVDDGKTWQSARTIPAGDGRWVAVVETPASGAEYVSLRAEATDTKGNSVKETILRAYAIGS